LKTIFGITYLYVVSGKTNPGGFVYVFDIFTEENNSALIAKLGEKFDAVGNLGIGHSFLFFVTVPPNPPNPPNLTISITPL